MLSHRAQGVKGRRDKSNGAQQAPERSGMETILCQSLCLPTAEDHWRDNVGDGVTISFCLWPSLGERHPSLAKQGGVGIAVARFNFQTISIRGVRFQKVQNAFECNFRLGVDAELCH